MCHEHTDLLKTRPAYSIRDRGNSAPKSECVSAISTIESPHIESLATLLRPCMCGRLQVTTVPTATLAAAVRKVASLAHPIQNHSLIQVESLLYPADFAVFVGLVG